MLWRASHTDTAKAAILGLIDVIKFGNPKESPASSLFRASRVGESGKNGDDEGERMDEDTKEPALWRVGRW